jgi:putative FmdB family regulatory protein
VPRYVYKCQSCETEFEVSHSFGETVDACSEEGCNSTEVERIPQFINLSKKQGVEAQVGSIVNNHIEEAREEVKTYKQEMKNWTPDK